MKKKGNPFPFVSAAFVAGFYEVVASRVIIVNNVHQQYPHQVYIKEKKIHASTSIQILM